MRQLPSRCFAQFRTYLGSASGAQSTQFIELDRRLGLISPESPVEGAFREAVTASGLDLAEVFRSNLSAGVMHRIANALLDIAQHYWRWKITHLSLVARLLGNIPGTAGTSGARYLTRRVWLPFPDLHEARRLADYS